MKFIFRWLLAATTLLIIAYYYIGVQVDGFVSALIVVLVLGLVNATIKPLILILTLPLNILTLGLFTFVINAFLFWMVGYLLEGFEVGGFIPAFWGAFIMSIEGWIAARIFD